MNRKLKQIRDPYSTYDFSYDQDQRLIGIVQQIQNKEQHYSELAYNQQNQLIGIKQYQQHANAEKQCCAIIQIAHYPNTVKAEYTWMDVSGNYQDEKEQISLKLNANNQVVGYKRILLPEYHILEERYSYDVDGNIICMHSNNDIDHNGDEIFLSYHFTYDQSVNALQNIATNLYWFIMPSTPLHKPGVGANNCLTIQQEKYPQDFEDYSPFTYHYDELGYPLVKYCSNKEVFQTYVYV